MEQAEYQKAYDEEMARLNGEAAPVEETVVTTEPEAVIEETKPVEEVVVEEQPQEQAIDPKALAEQLEATSKALKDTQRWGHQNAAELKALRKQIEEQERAKSRPEILDAFDGLEDAIKHVARVEKPEEKTQESWTDSVSRAIPDIEKLLEVPEFKQAAFVVREQAGSDWDDPLTAIRELGELRTKYYQYQAAQSAKAAAQKDFEARAKKSAALSVPGGSGKAAPVKSDAVSDVWGMTDDEFIKQRNKILGY